MSYSRLNDNFELSVAINTAAMEWVPSPMSGVERKMLDRVGAEIARATSLVRYAPSAVFSRHTHGGGEEILVLQGVFNDANGCYPAGTYIRNPVGSSHAPWAGPEGTVIFVKLHQFQEQDSRQLVIDTHQHAWHAGSLPGLSIMPLHELGNEQTALVRWAPDTCIRPHQHLLTHGFEQKDKGEEILILEGMLKKGMLKTRDHNNPGDNWYKGSWLRSPDLFERKLFTGPEGALLYVKTGHLGSMTDKWRARQESNLQPPA